MTWFESHGWVEWVRRNYPEEPPMARMPGAVWRPLPEAETKLQARKTQVITHTMVGYLGGTDALFRRHDIVTESTFGVGGPWDGPDLDGAVWQWMDSMAKADANYTANALAVSIETSDGGNPDRPWSDKQIAALLRIYEWMADTHGVPRRICRNANDPGYGYHALFPEWNTSGHSCPGSTRIAQWHDIVMPRFLNPPPKDDDMNVAELDAYFASDKGKERIRAAVLDSHTYGDRTLEQVLVAGANAAVSLTKPQA